jgi:hypothetical protein
MIVSGQAQPAWFMRRDERDATYDCEDQPEHFDLTHNLSLKRAEPKLF